MSVQTLCYQCGRACGKNKCSWSESFIPVPGWNVIYDKGNDSYTVIDCPLFKDDFGPKAKELDTEGCQELVAAMLKLLIKDYVAGVGRKDIERFIRSKRFANMSNTNPVWLIEKLREMAKREDEKKVVRP